jgi:hypothetical protein
MRTQGAVPRLAAALTAAALLFGLAAAQADEPLSGYRSAEFGMSAAQVRARLEGDGVIATEEYQTDDGDLIIDGHLADEAEAETGVRYVFPAGRDRLALVLEFHPDSADAAAVQARLEQAHGAPWAEDLAERWFEQLKGDMPEGVRELVVWGGDQASRDRFIRLWVFDDYLSVEYLHLGLLSAQP